MGLDCKFEIAMSCRSVLLRSLEPDQQYPIVHAKHINTRYGQSVLLAILQSPTTSGRSFYRNGTVISCQTKICRSSIQSVSTYI